MPRVPHRHDRQQPQLHVPPSGSSALIYPRTSKLDLHLKVTRDKPRLTPSAAAAAQPTFASVFFSKRVLTLHPGQTGSFPTGDPPSMTVGVERPLETIRHISTSPIPGIRHGFRSHATSATRSADEEQLGLLVGTRRRENLTETLRECSVDPALRRRLPFDRQNPLSDLRQIGKTDECPLRTCAHIDQKRLGILFEVAPDLFHRDILNVDDFHRLHLRPPLTQTSRRTAFRRPPHSLRTRQNQQHLSLPDIGPERYAENYTFRRDQGRNTEQNLAL
jgi:hypothetical protein